MGKRGGSRIALEKNGAKEEQMQPGKVFHIPYPFIRTSRTVIEEDGACEVPCWRPGVFRPPHDEAFAHGMGTQVLTVVGIYKPGGYQTRVFYIQQWIPPSGPAFGKGALRVCLARSFAEKTRGYRYDYRLEPPPEEETA
jgi:hypothetical protein